MSVSPVTEPIARSVSDSVSGPASPGSTDAARAAPHSGTAAKSATEDSAPILLHASAVAFGPDRGLAIIGPSGSGKSSLALALIAAGAQLLGDDRLHVFARDGALFARPPRAIAGLIEHRAFGIMRLGSLRLARLRLLIDMSTREERRLPPEDTRLLCGINLPCLRAPVNDVSALATFPMAIHQYINGLDQD